MTKILEIYIIIDYVENILFFRWCCW